MIRAQDRATANSNRIARRFAALRDAGELGIVAYITAGDPSLDATLKFVLALAEAGADVIELGVPFSDPLADGPTIQRASERALKAGATLAGVLDLVRRIRQSNSARAKFPLVLFSYYNPILQMGLEKFAAAASAAGADGVLVTDLTPEESGGLSPHSGRAQSRHDFSRARRLPPTSACKIIAACSSGFLYLISRTGVTGAKDSLPDDLAGADSPRAQRHTNLPIAVGFGISLPGHVSVLGGLADAAVVGSALVSRNRKSAQVGRCRRAQALVANASACLKEAARNRLVPARGRAMSVCRIGGAASMRSIANWCELLNERSRCALEIGKLKQAANLPLYQPDREKRSARERASSANPGPLTDAAIRRLFERIIDEARSAEREAMHEDSPTSDRRSI